MTEGSRMGRSDKIRLAGAVLGMSAVALAVNPAVGSAAVTGAGNVAVAGATFSTVLTNVNTTKPFVKCEGTVYDASKTDYQPGEDPNVKLHSAAGGPKVGSSYTITGPTMAEGTILAGASGSGTSAEFAPGEYWVRTKCKEGDDVNYQDPLAPIKLTITNTGPGGTGSSASDLLGGIFGSS